MYMLQRAGLLALGLVGLLLNSGPVLATNQMLREKGDKLTLNIHITGTVTADGSCTFSKSEAR